MKVAGGQRHGDEQNRDREVGQHLSDHDLRAAQRRDEELRERAGLAFARDRAGHQCHGQQLENHADDAGHDEVDEAQLRIVENRALQSPRLHCGGELLRLASGICLPSSRHLVGQFVDHVLPRIRSEIRRALFEWRPRFAARIRVRPVEFSRTGSGSPLFRPSPQCGGMTTSASARSAEQIHFAARPPAHCRHANVLFSFNSSTKLLAFGTAIRVVQQRRRAGQFRTSKA